MNKTFNQPLRIKKYLYVKKSFEKVKNIYLCPRKRTLNLNKMPLKINVSHVRTENTA